MSDDGRQNSRTAARPGAAGPMGAWRGQMDRAFEDFFRSWGAPAFAPPLEMGAARGAAIAPRVDVRETGGAVEISAELPGLAEDDVEVTLHEGVLTIEGEKREESESREAELWLSERDYGSFRRSFSLPDSLDPDSIEARFDRGVLRISIAKRPAAARPEPRSIPIG